MTSSYGFHSSPGILNSVDSTQIGGPSKSSSVRMNGSRFPLIRGGDFFHPPSLANWVTVAPVTIVSVFSSNVVHFFRHSPSWYLAPRLDQSSQTAME